MSKNGTFCVPLVHIHVTCMPTSIIEVAYGIRAFLPFLSLSSIFFACIPTIYIMYANQLYLLLFQQFLSRQSLVFLLLFCLAWLAILGLHYSHNFVTSIFFMCTLSNSIFLYIYSTAVGIYF